MIRGLNITAVGLLALASAIALAVLLFVDLGLIYAFVEFTHRGGQELALVMSIRSWSTGVEVRWSSMAQLLVGNTTRNANVMIDVYVDTIENISPIIDVFTWIYRVLMVMSIVSLALGSIMSFIGNRTDAVDLISMGYRRLLSILVLCLLTLPLQWIEPLRFSIMYGETVAYTKADTGLYILALITVVSFIAKEIERRRVS